MTARLPTAMEALPRAFAERLWAEATTILAKAGKTIVATGSGSSQVYILLDGRVQATLFSLAGREVILRDLNPGAMFGELAAIDDRPRSASVVAISDCVLAAVPAESFRHAISDNVEGATWIARRLTTQVRDLTEKVFELNSLRVRDRLHCELLRLCGDSGRDGTRVTLDPSPTHAELASRVGTHREAVTREMRFLVDQGIVEQDRRRVTIADLPALEQLVRAAAGEIDSDRTGRASEAGLA